MITKLNSSNPSINDRSVYNTRSLDLSIARNNFINATSSFASSQNFNDFITYTYTNSLQEKLNFWLCSDYGYDSVNNIGLGNIGFLEELTEIPVDRLYFYSKLKEYSGSYLVCPTNLTNAKIYVNPSPSDPYRYIKFSNTESLYYHPTVDKSLPLHNSDKQIVIVASPLNSSYEFNTNENDWLFSYGLEWVSSLQPSSEGLCFTKEMDSSLGKRLSFTSGGNNNLLTSANSGIETKGVISIKYDTDSKVISTKFNGLTSTITGLNYSIPLNHINDIRYGNGFFLNSYIISNSIDDTTEAYNRMKNWEFYEMMIFDSILTSTEESNLTTYLKTKYGIV